MATFRKERQHPDSRGPAAKRAEECQEAKFCRVAASKAEDCLAAKFCLAAKVQWGKATQTYSRATKYGQAARI